MKRIRRQLIFAVCSCLLLMLPCPMNVRTQQAEQGKKVFDTYSTVIGAVYPVAGTMFKVTGQMLDLFGYFGKSADPVGDAIKRINERLDILEKRMAETENRLRAVENNQWLDQNRARLRFLKDRHQELQDLADELREKPTERGPKVTLANQAQRIASRFLDDPDMDIWKWSDMREKDQVMMPANFKPLPALEYYVVSLVTWMAAMENASEGDYEVIKREYGRELQKHITFLSVRSGWREGSDDPPASLPENIKARVSCSLELLNKSPHAITRKCSIHEGCEDRLSRVLTTIAVHEETAPVGSEICNVPFSTKKMASEDELERMYGTELMEKLAAKLELLKTSGTVRENFIGTFDPSTQTAQFLYAMKPNGELLWYMHRVVTRKTGGASPRVPSPTERARRHDTRVGNLDPRIGVPAESGTFARVEVTHQLDGPKRIGSGWESFRQVMPAGLSGVYALTQEGKLLWYQHINYEIGARSWTEPREVGSGWGDFKQIIPMGDGIVYALTHDGKLLWYRHINFANGVKAWEGPKDVGADWQNYKQVFAGGEGVIYAVTDAGVLKWYRNKNYLTGVRDWEGPRDVGTGWQNFKTIFSPGEGTIYAMRPTGELGWYKHDGYKDGSLKWQQPVQIAADWKDFVFVFPRMAGTYVDRGPR